MFARNRVTWAAPVIAGIAAVLALGLSVPAASAASLPSCLGSPQASCTTNPIGEAGYYGADDNHTHYRYVQTVTVAEPQLVNLNGASNAGPGAVGAELCDPNIGPNGLGTVAQVGLWWNAAANAGKGGFQVSYGVGDFTTPAQDPCIQDGFAVTPLTSALTILSSFTINPGDHIFLAVWYAPVGEHFHQFSFGVCDINLKVCRQAYSPAPWQVNLDEFGIGAITNNVNLTAPANNLLDNFSDNAVTCYSCAGMVPITSIQPVNPFGIGGLYEAQFANSSSQIILSANDTLNTVTAGADAFNIYNGSTSP